MARSWVCSVVHSVASVDNGVISRAASCVGCCIFNSRDYFSVLLPLGFKVCDTLDLERSIFPVGPKAMNNLLDWVALNAGVLSVLAAFIAFLMLIFTLRAAVMQSRLFSGRGTDEHVSFKGEYTQVMHGDRLVRGREAIVTSNDASSSEVHFLPPMYDYDLFYSQKQEAASLEAPVYIKFLAGKEDSDTTAVDVRLDILEKISLLEKIDLREMKPLLAKKGKFRGAISIKAIRTFADPHQRPTKRKRHAPHIFGHSRARSPSD